MNINDEMIRKGMAWAFERYLDDPKQRAHFVTLQEEAKSRGLGVWQGQAQPPWEYRKDRWKRYAERSPRKGCPIIGNKKSNLYHTPWSPNYPGMFAKLVVKPNAGKEWLRDEAEAVLKGYKRAHAR